MDSSPESVGDVAEPIGLLAAVDSAEELSPDCCGRWLVVTRGSEHVFDLDVWTYSRRPRTGHGQFRNDGHTVRLTRVERWPRVGETFLIWVDDHEFPDALEHWHQSSPIQSITRLRHASEVRTMPEHGVPPNV